MTATEIIIGLLSIEESVTMGQEADRRKLWVPLAKQFLDYQGVDWREECSHSERLTESK